MGKKRFSRIFWRGALIFVEATAVLAVLAVIGVGILSWRLQSAPLEVDFAKEFIEESLRNPDRGYLKVGRVMLHWPDLRGPLLLGMEDGRVYNNNDDLIASVDEVALGLSRARLLIGQISPVALVIKKPNLTVLRTASGKIDIGFGAMTGGEQKAGPDEERVKTDLVERVLSYIAQPGSQKGQHRSLGTLRTFRIEQAKAHFIDRINGLSVDIPSLDAALQSTDSGLQAEVSAALGGHERPLTMSLAFDWATRESILSAEIEQFPLHSLADKVQGLEVLAGHNLPVSFKVQVKLDANQVVKQGALVAVSQGGHVQHDFLSHEPVSYKSLKAKIGYFDGVGSEPDQLVLQDFALELDRVNIKGTGTFDVERTGADVQSARGSLTLTIPDMEQSAIGPLWPQAMDDDNSKEWVVDKLSDGSFSDVEVSFKVSTQRDAETGKLVLALDNVWGGFSFRDMTIAYKRGMSPVTQSFGKGRFDYNSELLAIDVTGGNAKGLEVKGAELEFLHIIEAGKGKADIYLTLSGPLRSAFSLIEEEPIGVEHGFDLERVEGVTDMVVNISFPTRSDVTLEEFNFDVRGTANNVVLPDVLGDVALTGGPFELAVDNETVNVAGKGLLAGQVADITYQAFIHSQDKPHKSRITAKGTVNEALRGRFGIDLSDFLSGPVPVNATYTEYGGGRATANVIADLGRSRFYLDPFQYEKPIGQTGSARFDIDFRNGTLTTIHNLKAAAPSFTLEDGELHFKSGRDLSHGTLGRFTLAETVGSAEFEYGANGTLKIAMNGAFLDLRPFLSGDNSDSKNYDTYDEPPMEISLAADRMRTADGETVQYGKIYAAIDSRGRFDQLEMDAIAGSGDVYLRYKPDVSGRRVFRLEADDAGAALSAFDVYDNIEGGTLVIYGEPIRGIYDRNLIGVAEINNFKVSNAPALAQLLGALSLPGVVSLLNDEGLTFTKLEAKFDWLYRPQGGLLVLKDGRTSGNSLGLTFDGTFDNAAGTLDVSGTIVPLSGINRALSSIPILGTILSGGSGSIFAATYSAEGEAKNPRIVVNPLAVLTPGILRRILFE